MPGTLYTAKLNIPTMQVVLMGSSSSIPIAARRLNYGNAIIIISTIISKHLIARMIRKPLIALLKEIKTQYTRMKAKRFGFCGAELNGGLIIIYSDMKKFFVHSYNCFIFLLYLSIIF